MKWAVALLCAILLAPLAIVDIPPLLDYPNHLARAVVLAEGTGDPVLSGMYVARWSVIPNLAVDIVLPPLLSVLPVHLAGRIVVGIILLLPVIGTIAYSRATFRVSGAWPLASGLVAYNATLLLGFLNFGASIGLALLLAAAWIAWRDRHPGTMVVAAAIGSVALFFCHLMGLLCFYVLIAGNELERLHSRGLRLSVAAACCGALIPAIAAPLGLYLVSPLAPLSGETVFLPVGDKARELIAPFANYLLTLDVATATIVVAFLVFCLSKRRCRVTLGSGVTLGLTALLFLAAPWAFKGTFMLDMRFAILLGFLLFAALLPTGLPRSATFAAVAVFAGLFGARMAVVAVAWDAQRHALAELRIAIAPVEPAARVLTAFVTPQEAPEYWRNAPLGRQLSSGSQLTNHLPALLLIERRAFWPFLFDNPSQQPVATLPPFDELAARADSFVGHRALEVPGKVDLCGFDYVLLLDAGGDPDAARFAADRLILLIHTNAAALFRIRPQACRRS